MRAIIIMAAIAALTGCVPLTQSAENLDTYGYDPREKPVRMEVHPNRVREITSSSATSYY